LFGFEQDDAFTPLPRPDQGGACELFGARRRLIRQDARIVANRRPADIVAMMTVT
jgi:hypothetical protein